MSVEAFDLIKVDLEILSPGMSETIEGGDKVYLRFFITGESSSLVETIEGA